jgi:hypothetical protein
MSAWNPKFQLEIANADQSDVPLCEALALKPPYIEMRSVTSTVSGTSTPMPWLDGDDGVGDVGRIEVSAESD